MEKLRRLDKTPDGSIRYSYAGELKEVTDLYKFKVGDQIVDPAGTVGTVLQCSNCKDRLLIRNGSSSKSVLCPSCNVPKRKRFPPMEELED